MIGIGGYWFVSTMRNPKPPMKNPRISKKQLQEYGKIKGKLEVARDHLKDEKFQFYWKKLEYDVTIKLNTKKTQFCMSSKKLF